MVPGVDLTGTVIASDSPEFAVGDEVISTGFRVGESYWGGYAERQRVRSEWLVKRPEGMSALTAMAIGTAGFTAMLCVMAIEGAGVTEKARAMETETWAGAVDTVGSKMLAKVISQMKYGGTVAACGLAGGADLPTTVMPFILRSVRLQGCDSVMAPMPARVAAWDRLNRDLPGDVLTSLTEVVPMTELLDRGPTILAGQVRGRWVVDPSS